MQIHLKPRLDPAALLPLLQDRWPQPITALTPLVEGEDSQALRFDSAGDRFALRLNSSDYGFQKDAYARQHFASPAIPIPDIYQIGQLNAGYAYCISEYISGATLESLERPAVEALLPATLGLLQAINSLDVSAAPGAGEFGPDGAAASATWRDWLLTHISPAHFDWDALVAAGQIEPALLQRVFETFQSLVALVPNERRLIHGDFGDGNLLASGGRLVAVLDWDAAGYGDPLFDVAGAVYWRGHLMCFDVQAAYYHQTLAHLPNYQARLHCYQLRAALIEMYVQAARHEPEKLAWHVRRCQALLGEING